MVFVGHLRNPMFLGYGAVSPADRILPVKLWYFLTGWHAEAVIVFFVLSGYLVGGLAAAKVQTGRFSLKDYAIDRSTRIYVAFLPALILTVVLDHFGSNWFGGAGLYTDTQPIMHDKLAMGAFTQNMSAQTFGFNLVLLQTFFAPPYGSNQPLWTISAEFWFYVVFGLAAFAFIRRRSYIGLALAFSCVATAGVLGLAFAGYMGLWLIGVAAAFLPKGRYEKPLFAVLFFAAALVLIRARQGSGRRQPSRDEKLFRRDLFLLASRQHAPCEPRVDGAAIEC